MVEVPESRVEWVNEYRPGAITGPRLRECKRVAEFSAEDALMTTEIEAASRESALRDGAKIGLTLDLTDLGSEHIIADSLRATFGVDPLDAERMMAIHFG